jgi:hypothetical protein
VDTRIHPLDGRMLRGHCHSHDEMQKGRENTACAVDTGHGPEIHHPLLVGLSLDDLRTSGGMAGPLDGSDHKKIGVEGKMAMTQGGNSRAQGSRIQRPTFRQIYVGESVDEHTGAARTAGMVPRSEGHPAQCEWVE